MKITVVTNIYGDDSFDNETLKESSTKTFEPKIECKFKEAVEMICEFYGKYAYDNGLGYVLVSDTELHFIAKVYTADTLGGYTYIIRYTEAK